MGVGEMKRSAEEKELTIRIQNEKKQQEQENAEPDLFSAPPPSETLTHRETHKKIEQGFDTPISNSREVEHEEPVKITKLPQNEIVPSFPTDSTVNKIVFFYSDSSFEVFYPKK
jgi:hypothetical protein